MTAIVAEHLVKIYGSLRAVDDMSFEVKDGEVCGMLGPNGGGQRQRLAVADAR